MLDSLFSEEERRPMAVSELNAQVKGELERRFSNVWVEGEIVNFIRAASGHWYFTLHDGFSQIRAVCYRGANWRIRFEPFDGLQARVRGKLTLYEPKGDYQILVESLEPVGEGAMKIAFEQIRAKLEAKGLFTPEHKRPLPFFPRRVGVVTSPRGAAFFDILQVLSRRARSVHVVLAPTRVQGETAAEEIADAINLANEFNAKAADHEKIDVLIVGRGGGSSEDLWAFNEEIVARAIFASEIPVISAVGHEIDFTIADLVADMRAPTPSAAAELVAQKEADIENYLRRSEQDLRRLIGYKMLAAKSELRELALSPVFADFPRQIGDLRLHLENLRGEIAESLRLRLASAAERLTGLSHRLSPARLALGAQENRARLQMAAQKQTEAMRKVLENQRQKLDIGMTRLDALSPLSVLGRGFSLTQKMNGEIVRGQAQVETGEDVNVQLAKGKLKARILEKLK
jgi:exodeoxyribonuclease VII large subunit